MSIDYDFENQIDRLSPRDVDELPVGAIQLAPDGKVLTFNRAESTLSGFAPSQVLGRNFFTEVAPCTKVQDFYGRFRDGVARRELHAKFLFTFKFGVPRGPIDVWITLFYSRQSESVWVFVRR